MFVYELTGFLVEQQLQSLCVFQRGATLTVWNSRTSHAWCDSLHRERVASDHQVLERRDVHDWVEQFVLGWHLIEREIKFLKVWEYLLVLQHLFVVFRKLSTVEFRKPVSRQVELSKVGDGAEGPHQSVRVD